MNNKDIALVFNEPLIDLIEETQFTDNSTHHTQHDKRKINVNTFKGCDFVSLSISECDFSSIHSISECIFDRCHLIFPKLSTLKITNITFKDTTFLNCSWSNFTFENCKFRNCTFIAESTLKNNVIRFWECDFSGEIKFTKFNLDNCATNTPNVTSKFKITTVDCIGTLFSERPDNTPFSDTESPEITNSRASHRTQNSQSTSQSAGAEEEFIPLSNRLEKMTGDGESSAYRQSSLKSEDGCNRHTRKKNRGCKEVNIYHCKEDQKNKLDGTEKYFPIKKLGTQEEATQLLDDIKSKLQSASIQVDSEVQLSKETVKKSEIIYSRSIHLLSLYILLGLLSIAMEYYYEYQKEVRSSPISMMLREVDNYHTAHHNLEKNQKHEEMDILIQAARDLSAIKELGANNSALILQQIRNSSLSPQIINGNTQRPYAAASSMAIGNSSQAFPDIQGSQKSTNKTNKIIELMIDKTIAYIGENEYRAIIKTLPIKISGGLLLFLITVINLRKYKFAAEQHALVVDKKIRLLSGDHAIGVATLMNDHIALRDTLADYRKYYFSRNDPKENEPTENTGTTNSLLDSLAKNIRLVINGK